MPTQVEMSGNADIDGILWGWKWSSNNLTYSFPTATTEYTNDGYTAVNGFQAFTAAQQTAAIRILAQYDNVSGVNFTQVAAGQPSSLRFAEATQVDDGLLANIGTATGTPPDPNEFPEFSHGDMWFNPTNYDQTPNPGTYTWTAGIMHEIGHTLGLKHGHVTQDVDHPGHTDNLPALPADHDTQEYSIMTYRGYPGAPSNEGTQEYPQTIMMNDISALQYMYGANFNHNSGGSIYTWNTTTGEMSINGISQNLATPNGHILMTIWDGGGTDTYDFSNYSTDLEVNLNPGEWTTVATNQLADLGPAGGGTNLARGNIANARLFQGDNRSLIENATGGSGDDVMIGNGAANTLIGNGGDDLLKGGGGADTLNGGTGDDELYGEGGDDTLNGGNQNDLLQGGAGGDTMNGGSGFDTAFYTESGAGVTIVLNSSQTTYGSGGTAQGDELTEIESVTGSSHDDTLVGNELVNVLNGMGGDDHIKGAGGADILIGGNGVDTASYIGSNAGVKVNLFTGIGEGGHAQGDSIAGFENVIGSDFNDDLRGTGDDNRLSGGNGDDSMKGFGGADTLVGGANNDILKGGGGADTLEGGSGEDTAVYSQSGFGVTIVMANGQGVGFLGDAEGDTLDSIENVLGSDHDDTIVGDANGNKFDGADGNDSLKGGGGSDTLIGSQGNDKLQGGAGADHFRYASTEGGTDTIYDFSQVEGDQVALDHNLGLPGMGLQSAGMDFVQGLQARTAQATVLVNGGDVYYDADGTGVQAAVKLSHMGQAMWTVGTTGDFDANGTEDFLWQNNATGDTIQWLMSTTGGVGYNAGLSNTAGYTLVGQGDMDANGTDDVLWQNNATGDTVQWLMSTTGGIGYQASIGSTAGYSIVGQGDFDANGTTDFMWKNAASGDTVQWLTQSIGGIGYQASLAGTSGWDVAATGDFDANGTTDFLWKNAGNGSTIEWLMSPSGGIGYQQAMGNLAGWNLSVAGDFDANGTTDLLWKNAADGTIVEWLTSAAGGTSYEAAIGNTAGYDLVMSGDIDGNNTTDFVWKNAASGETIEWLTQPGGGIGYQAALGSTDGYTAVANGDFNNDGASDILWQNAATGETIEWLLSPAGGVGYQAALTNTAGWSVLATGDFNADGTTDISWEQASDGSTVEWLMSANGGVMSETAMAGTGGQGVVHLTQDDFLVV